MNFSSQEYWEKRYKLNLREGFEWYVDFDVLRTTLEKILKKNYEAEILLPGCGSSLVPIHLYEMGFRNLTCVDFSETVIEAMHIQYSKLGIDWVVMDAREMNVPTACFDIVIDKALFDAVCCSESNAEEISHLLEEVHRVLRQSGLYVIISHGKPGTRVPYFKACRKTWQLLESVKLVKAPVSGFEDEDDSVFLYVFQRL